MENYYLILSDEETCSESDDESLGTPSPRENIINNNFELIDKRYIIGFIFGYIVGVFS